MHQANRRPTLRIKQHHHPLVRLHPLSKVFRKHANQLRPKASLRPHRPRHHPKHPPLPQRQYRPQQLQRLPPRKRNHRLPHNRNTPLIRKPLRHFLPINPPHHGRATPNSPAPKSFAKRTFSIIIAASPACAAPPVTCIIDTPAQSCISTAAP